MKQATELQLTGKYKAKIIKEGSFDVYQIDLKDGKTISVFYQKSKNKSDATVLNEIRFSFLYKLLEKYAK